MHEGGYTFLLEVLFLFLAVVFFDESPSPPLPFLSVPRPFSVVVAVVVGEVTDVEGVSPPLAFLLPLVRLLLGIRVALGGVTVAGGAGAGAAASTSTTSEFFLLPPPDLLLVIMSACP